MKRVVAGTLALVCAAAVGSATGSAAQPERAAKGILSYAACKKSAKQGTPFCFAGSRPVAFLRAYNRERLEYRVCLRGGGKPVCKRAKTTGLGRLSRVRFGKQSKGKYYLVWFANGRKVNRDRLIVHKRSVFVVGDSLGVGTEPFLPKKLKDWKVSQSVKVGRHGFEAISILRNRGSLPGAIVMSIGGNDDPNNVNGFRSIVAKTMQIAGPTRCVVWPNHYATKPVNGGNFDGYNRVLEEFEKKYRNFQIMNWAKIARAHPGWMAGDGIHVNATGYEARAAAIAETVRSC